MLPVVDVIKICLRVEKVGERFDGWSDRNSKVRSVSAEKTKLFQLVECLRIKNANELDRGRSFQITEYMGG